MEQYIWSRANRYLTTNDDDFTTSKQTEQLRNVLYINMVIFAILVTLFEMLRHIKAIFLNRYCGKFLKLGRVPPKPGFLPFSWIWTIMHISEDEVLRMVGLDGYMLLRYLTVCFRTACFFAFFGSVILAPVYWSGDNGLEGWGRFTLANIPDGPTNYLWVPVIFAYVFTMFFCQLMYLEYVNFKEKRVQYIVTGDADTPGQTYYTVMIERLPTSLRSTSALQAFFDKLFPGQIFNVEVAVDLNDLEDLVHNRRLVRNKLEKAIAIFKATKQRPKQWVKASMYKGEIGRPVPVEDSWIAGVLGYEVHDAIDHFEHLLDLFNNNVAQLQRAYYDQRQTLDDDERSRLQILRDKLRNNEQLAGVVNTIGTIGKTGQQIIASGSSKLRDVATTSLRVPAPTKTDSPRRVEDAKDGDDAELSMSRKRDSSYGSSNNLNPLHTGAKIVGTGVEGIAREGIETAKVATKGAWKGVRAATRALELLTVGAYYTISSTGFVTFTNRVAKCSAEQMLLSHEFYNLDVLPAPNPRDLLWDNVSIPSQQIEMRKTIAGVMFGVGAIFWSLVVAFISAISNLESIAQVIPSLQKYSDTDAYQLLNNYLAIGLLLLLLALLPFVFDFVSRSYEGLKQESEIQNSIMARYFYYSLANVFVAVGLGSIASSLHQIIEDPASILTILGSSVPSFSTYFASLLIIRTCTAVPIEMLRLIPLLDILGVQLCYDKKKCTRRELRAGAFADPPMLYGWIYPNIIMVLMILFTYCCIAPFISPLSACYFGLVYLMYKYQLLYVYINSYQSGGFMWYAVFDRSMLALMCGVFTLLCYLAIRQTYTTGPLYALLPLPVLIGYFWRLCNARFKAPARSLSLERAQELDEAQQSLIPRPLADEGSSRLSDPVTKTFSRTLFRQPSLAEGRLKPAPYRIAQRNAHSSRQGSTLSSPLMAPHSPALQISGSNDSNMDVSRASIGSEVERMSLSHYLDPEFDEELNADDYEIEAEVAAFLEDAELGAHFDDPISFANPSNTDRGVDLEASRSDIEQPDGGGSYGSMGFTAVEMARKAHHDLPN